MTSDLRVIPKFLQGEHEFRARSSVSLEVITKQAPANCPALMDVSSYFQGKSSLAILSRGSNANLPLEIAFWLDSPGKRGQSFLHQTTILAVFREVVGLLNKTFCREDALQT